MSTAENQSFFEAHEKKRVDTFIPLERLGVFNRKVAVMQAAAARLDLPPWEVTFGEKEWRPFNVNGDPVFDHVDALGHSARTMQLEGHPVSIVGDAPVLAGWRFLAKIEHEDGGNLVKRMTGGDNSPLDWHTCGPNCSHCDVSRQRNNTYMLSNVETGEVKQVGSSCITDFLGEQARDPDRIAAMYDYLTVLEREFEYDPDLVMDSAGHFNFGIEPVVLIAATLKISQEDGGYISAEKGATLGCLSTGDRLRAAFWSSKPIAVVPDAAQVEMAPKVVDWLKEQKDAGSLWLRNIAYLADRSCITSKDAGLLASGYIAWNRDLQQKLKAERGSGDWVGVSGDKVSVSATLERHAGFDTQYGYKTVLSFRDEEGNGLTWKTQSPPNGLVVGSNYRLLATVKEHGEYKGEKQTEIIRVKVAELEIFSFGALPGFRKLAAVAKPDVVDERGHSPLFKALLGDHVEHAKVLLSAGADANQLNQGEIPILGYANSPAMVRVLLDAGARAEDLLPEHLEHMEVDAREAVIAGMPVLESIEAIEEVTEKISAGQQVKDSKSIKAVKVTETVAANAAINDFSSIAVDTESVVLTSQLGQLDFLGFDLPVASHGQFSGPILSVENGVAVQRTGRNGATTAHDVSRLSAAVSVGSAVLDIEYKDGLGVVSGLGLAGLGVGR